VGFIAQKMQLFNFLYEVYYPKTDPLIFLCGVYRPKNATFPLSL